MVLSLSIHLCIFLHVDRSYLYRVLKLREEIEDNFFCQ